MKEEEKKPESNLEEKEKSPEKNLKEEEKKTEKKLKEKKEKSEVKKIEFEADKLASIYWWKTFGIKLLLVVMWAIILYIGNKYIGVFSQHLLCLTSEDIFKFYNAFSVFGSIVTLLLSIVFILVAINIAFNNVSKKAIVKTNKLKPIMDSYKTKTYILLMIEIVILVYLVFIKEVSILAGLIYLVSSFTVALIQNAYAKKLLNDIAEDNFPL